MSPRPTTLHTWLQLVRAPNLFTVPGDPLAGFLLVSGGRLDWRIACAVLASLCFYAYGLLLNDLADLYEDLRERPSRPLPSGAVKPRTVQMVATALAVGGLLFAALTGPTAFYAGLALIAVILLYNLWAKRVPILGPVNMGVCRGLSLLLGALAAKSSGISLAALPLVVWLAAAGLTLYIALVTNLARIETQANPPRLPRSLPFAGLTLAAVPVFVIALNLHDPFAPGNVALYAVVLYTLYAGSKIHRKLGQNPAPPIPPMIGQLIRLLLPLQAIWCLASRSTMGAVSAAVLLILWPISRNVSRKFYAS